MTPLAPARVLNIRHQYPAGVAPASGDSDTMSASVSAAGLDPVLDGELPPKVVLASMAGVMAAMLMAALDGTIVGTAMPRVIAELQGFQHYAAVTTIYMLASTVVVPIVGKLSDLYGRKPFLLVGVTIFIIGSMLCGAATSMTWLVAARGFQGIGAGFSQATAFTTIADLYPPARRGRITGVMGSVFGLASIVGPAVGGLLTDGPGWRWCFYVNVPVGLVALAILFFFFPNLVTPRARTPKVDWVGAATLVMGVVPLLLALSWGGRDYAWGSREVVSLLAAGLGMTALFLFLQTRTDEALMPPALFKPRVVWTSAAAATLVSIGMFGTVLFIPLFIQGVVGRSATQSGAIVTPMMFSLIGASIVSGQLVTRLGKYKMLAVAGVTITTAGMGLLALMDEQTAYSTVLRNMVVMGVGLGMTMPVFNLAVQNAVDPANVGVMTSSLQFLRSIGGSLGAAIFGAVLTNRFSPAFHTALPAQVAAGLPPQLVQAFENPQAMMDPRMAARIQAAGPDMAERMVPVFGAVRHALSASLHDVFVFGALLAAAGLAFALFIVDIPLRKTNRPVHAPAEVL
ncbi:MAG: MDR family MFS transporter [Vicinamibacterales bacterium]